MLKINNRVGEETVMTFTVRTLCAMNALKPGPLTSIQLSDK